MCGCMKITIDRYIGEKEEKEKRCRRKKNKEGSLVRDINIYISLCIPAYSEKRG